MIDPLVENSRQVRDQLFKEFGGLQGLCDKLEEMDRTRTQNTARKQQPRKSSKAVKLSGVKPPKSSL